MGNAGLRGMEFEPEFLQSFGHELLTLLNGGVVVMQDDEVG